MIRKSSQNLVSDPVRIFKVFFLLAWSEETSLSVHHCPLLYEKAITASLTTLECSGIPKRAQGQGVVPLDTLFPSKAPRTIVIKMWKVSSFDFLDLALFSFIRRMFLVV
uniref:Uncharacterized protein n=1 Tax=Entomoneis paludosa TaxID=265537 RepID=A0A7S3DTP6_9STRA|mmetsp:Transcript_34486/g.71822  ORF Transcript_34486/g.71822 Transcript_34486/m.71822 type:complete len:109 (+) Transcript_34486:287-613(+)